VALLDDPQPAINTARITDSDKTKENYLIDFLLPFQDIYEDGVSMGIYPLGFGRASPNEVDGFSLWIIVKSDTL
jgi:hypothetical protein